MTPVLSLCRSALAVTCLLFVLVLPASVSNAVGQDITYNIIVSPLTLYPQLGTNGTDTISGTIITDGKTGPLSPTDIVGGSLTYQNSINGAYTVPLQELNVDIYGTFTATQATLSLPWPSLGTEDLFQLFTPGSSSTTNPFSWDLSYDRQMDTNGYESDGVNGGLIHAPGSGQSTVLVYFSGGATPDSPPDPLANVSWVIATAVPEPTSLTLFGSALLGFGAVYLRRRRATA